MVRAWVLNKFWPILNFEHGINFLTVKILIGQQTLHSLVSASFLAEKVFVSKFQFYQLGQNNLEKLQNFDVENTSENDDFSTCMKY